MTLTSRDLQPTDFERRAAARVRAICDAEVALNPERYITALLHLGYTMVGPDGATRRTDIPLLTAELGA